MVTFNLVRRMEEVISLTSKKVRKNSLAGKLKHFVPAELKIHPNKSKPYISGRRYDKKEPRRPVLFANFSKVFGAGFTTMNWGGLSGWGVNGGLPSLGKRSR